MKKMFVIGASLMALGLSAHASSSLPALGTGVTAAPSPYKVSVSLTSHNELYEEFADDGKLMQEDAAMVGLGLKVTRALSEAPGQFELDLHLAQGNSTYTGSYWGGNYGDVRKSGLDRLMFESHLSYRHAAPAWNGVGARVGLGYRHLTDRLDQLGEGGYERENNRVYLSLGADRAFKVNALGAWTVTPLIKYKHVLWSQQFSDLYGGLYHSQNKGYGVDAEIAFTHQSEGYAFSFTPYYRTWKMEDSKVVANTYEPENKTREVGVALGMTF